MREQRLRSPRLSGAPTTFALSCRADADVLAFCRAELMQQNYFHAVLEAAKSVADKLRTLSGVSGDSSSLVDATCSQSSVPRVVFNSLATDWERSEQTGIEGYSRIPPEVQTNNG